MPIKINVPFDQKEEANKLGAIWIPDVKTWAIPNYIENVNSFKAWLPQAGGSIVKSHSPFGGYMNEKKTPRTVEFLGILALLLIFEFITLLVHPYIKHLTDDTPAIMLLMLVAIAAFLVPLHQKMEKWVKERLAHKDLPKLLPVQEEDIVQSL